MKVDWNRHRENQEREKRKREREMVIWGLTQPPLIDNRQATFLRLPVAAGYFSLWSTSYNTNPQSPSCDLFSFSSSSYLLLVKTVLLGGARPLLDRFRCGDEFMIWWLKQLINFFVPLWVFHVYDIYFFKQWILINYVFSFLVFFFNFFFLGYSSA